MIHGSSRCEHEKIYMGKNLHSNQLKFFYAYIFFLFITHVCIQENVFSFCSFVVSDPFSSFVHNRYFFCVRFRWKKRSQWNKDLKKQVFCFDVERKGIIFFSCSSKLKCIKVEEIKKKKFHLWIYLIEKIRTQIHIDLASYIEMNKPNFWSCT